MTIRAETTAATRQGLLDAAGALLDTGGPEAVTLRAVGASAGVSRSAPYRHFADKESLLMAVAAEAWVDVGDRLETMVSRPDGSPELTLRGALLVLIAVSRAHPHLYRLMFTAQAADPAAASRAAERAQGFFLELVTNVLGPGRDRKYAALLLTSVHGIADLELSGHFMPDKWDTTAEELLELMIEMLPADSRVSPRNG